ncbi:MAG TPA: response regulator [Thermoanaerobaculia bacterium]|nr:response regulator [Thermoanaerobaculia bacterium]
MPEERSVLIIDDNKPTRAIAAAVLLRAGFKITEAEDAARAVELLIGEQYSVILLDFKTPHDGVAMIDYMSENLPDLLSRTIVFMPAINRPIWGVLSKPIEPTELLTAVTDCAASGMAA